MVSSSSAFKLPAAAVWVRVILLLEAAGMTFLRDIFDELSLGAGGATVGDGRELLESEGSEFPGLRV